MLKSRAIELLGGTVTAAAEAVGISSSAVTQWPDQLPRRISDRVLAVLARKHLPAELLGEERQAVAPVASAPAASNAREGLTFSRFEKDQSRTDRPRPLKRGGSDRGGRAS